MRIPAISGAIGMSNVPATQQIKATIMPTRMLRIIRFTTILSPYLSPKYTLPYRSVVFELGRGESIVLSPVT